MNIIANYDKILEDNLREELYWLEKEFDVLFEGKKKQKKKYTNQDISIANGILEKVLEHITPSNNELLINLLASTIENIEKKYHIFKLNNKN